MKIRRLLAILLTVIMMMTMIPVETLAAGSVTLTDVTVATSLLDVSEKSSTEDLEVTYEDVAEQAALDTISEGSAEENTVTVIETQEDEPVDEETKETGDTTSTEELEGVEETVILNEEPSIEVKEDNKSQEEPLPAVSMPAQSFTGRTDDIIVDVQADEGAFPEGTTMEVLALEDQAKIDAVVEVVDDATENDVVTMVAVDIIFKNASGEKIEPEKEIRVSFTTDKLEEAERYSVVHVQEDEQTSELIAEVLDEEQIEGEVTQEGAEFVSDAFSVYVIVGESSQAQMTVEFYNDTEKISSMIVKQSDTLEELETILYDPGAGVLEEGEFFRGWTTEENYTTETDGMMIEEVREYVSNLTITDGSTLKLYATIYKLYRATFEDEDGIVITSETRMYKSGDTPTYVINVPYTPKNQDAEFLGWSVDTGAEYVEAVNSEDEKTDASGNIYYVNGTEIYITGDVIFAVKIPTGYWLSFQENGDGASYTPPQFIEASGVTQEPDDPTRFGYTFGGWFTNAECTGSQFTFGGTISERTTLYAKWNANVTANYTVIIWKESMSDIYEANGGTNSKNYDFAESITLTGTVGNTINTVTRSGSSYVDDGDSSGTRYYNAVVNGTTKSYTGYHCATFDEGVTIVTEGTSVVNVYYDRNTVTYTFYTYESIYTYTISTSNRDWWYYIPDGNGGYTQVYLYSWESNWYNWYTGEVYTGYRYERSSNDSWQVYQDSTGLYGETLNWPSDTSYWWYPTGYNKGRTGGTRMTYKAAFLPDGTDMNVEYYGTQMTSSSQIRFYTQSAADEDTYDLQMTVPTSDGPFRINDKFTGFSAYQYRYYKNYSWSEWKSAGTKGSDGNYNTTESGYDILEIRYNRISASITYLDGAYFDGNGNALDVAAKADEFSQSDEIAYQSDLTSYNEGGANYYEPENYHDGYVFAGWYADDVCTHPYTFTTMPSDGVTVYAKWVQTQYRVFLHPNAGTDESLEWGQTGQQMSFRVTYGDKVGGGSDIAGTRDDYELVGWYTDEACKKAFNFDVYVLNDTTVTEVYDQTESTELNQWGNPTENTNKDAENNRFWIKKKLSLYAKWRSKLEGAKGIDVVYTAGEGTNPPTDSKKYLDSAEAIAQTASTAPSGKQFKHWVVQTWDETSGTYADTTTTVLPGDTFTVLKANAHQIPNADNTPENPSYTYTVQLRAEYSEPEEASTTSITWYANNGTTDSVTDADLEINEVVDIKAADTFAYADHTFLGWGKTASDTTPWIAYEDGVFTYNGQTVTKVGADLAETVKGDAFNVPNVLYAIWESDLFYVWHSSDNITDTYKISENPSFNIVTKVKSGYIYGGYYGKNGGEYTEVYTGGDDFWEMSDAYTASGLAITPEPDKTYYLKEVPNTYLLPSEFDTFHSSTKGIYSIYVLSTVDDTNYTDVRFQLGTEDVSVKDNLYEKVEVTYASPLTPGDDLTELTTENIAGNEKGYIALYDLGDPVTKANTSMYIRMSWVTPDSVQVKGVKMRKLTIGATSECAENDSAGNPVTRTAVKMDDVKVIDYTVGRLNTVYATTGATTTSKLILNASVLAITVTPQEAPQCTITVVDNGTEDVMVVDPGDWTGQIGYAGRTGYLFAGWYLDEEYSQPADLSSVSEDMTIYAKYVRRSAISAYISAGRTKKGITPITATFRTRGLSVSKMGLGYSCNDENGDVAAALGNAEFSLTNLHTGDKILIEDYYVTEDGTKVVFETRTYRYIFGFLI